MVQTGSRVSRSSTRGFACLAWIATLMLLAGCMPAPAVTASTCGSAPDSPPVTGVFVEPDDGYRPVIDEFDAAMCTIDLCIYLLSDPIVLESLIAAHWRGVTVRVQIEEHPFGGSFDSTAETLALLEQAGIEWRYTSDRFRFSHAKYAVVDRAVGLVMNQNLTSSAFSGNREFGTITTDPAVVDDLQAVFEADWLGVEQDFSASEVMLSPDNGRGRLITTIARAHATIDMYAEVVRDEEVVDALIAAGQRGVSVRLLVNPSLDDLDFSVYTRLADGGVTIHTAPHLYIHAKALVVDGTLAIIGSHNPTSASLDDNREVSLIIGDLHGIWRIVRTFAGDWNRSDPIFP
jgi:phosphatidylserine/phosphatidylglycerophosphate/cardiolipin synthase-like enzyme